MLSRLSHENLVIQSMKVLREKKQLKVAFNCFWLANYYLTQEYFHLNVSSIPVHVELLYALLLLSPHFQFSKLALGVASLDSTFSVSQYLSVSV